MVEDKKKKSIFGAQPSTMASATCPICEEKEWLYPTPDDLKKGETFSNVIVSRRDEEFHTMDVVYAACTNCGFIRYHMTPIADAEVQT